MSISEQRSIRFFNWVDDKVSGFNIDSMYIRDKAPVCPNG